MERISLFISLTIFYFAYFYKQTTLAQRQIKTNQLAQGSKPPRTKKSKVDCSLGLTLQLLVSILAPMSRFWKHKYE